MNDQLTINVSSRRLTIFWYPPYRPDVWTSGQTSLVDAVEDWLKENTPSATWESYYTHTTITFTAREDLIMFKLVFSDEL